MLLIKSYHINLGRSVSLLAPRGIIQDKLFGYPILARLGNPHMDTRNYTCVIHRQHNSEDTGRLISRAPLFLFSFIGLFLLRLAERAFRGLLFQEAPRRTKRLKGGFPNKYLIIIEQLKSSS